MSEKKDYTKYRLIIEFETNEKQLGKKDIKSILEKSWLYDYDFDGAVTKEEIKKIRG